MALTKLNLEYQADKFLKDPSEENDTALMNEIVRVLLEDGEVLIDGEKMDDGQVDPAHMEVELDHRFYFHVYTSKLRFDKCGAKHAFVISLKKLLEPMYQNETFGGISINYEKNQEVVLISKENVFDALQAYLNTNNGNQ